MPKYSYHFFQNTDCEYFPCHKNIVTELFNCLFCFCPLYLSKNCIGTPVYLNSGIKDCSHCIIPHNVKNYHCMISAISTMTITQIQKQTHSQSKH